MKTADALKIGMALGRISKTLDAWEESKHPRADNGQFSSGGGGGAKKIPSNLKYNKRSTELIKKSKSAEHWMNKKEAAREEAVKKFKEQIKNGTISSKEKKDLAEGRAMVKSGEWTKNDYERQIRGIAISKMENGDFESKQSKPAGGSSSNRGESAYRKLKSHHRDDVNEVLKTAAGSKLGGTEVGANLPPKERGKVGEIRDAYKNGKMSREDAQNKIADIYRLAHEDYDNGKW